MGLLTIEQLMWFPKKVVHVVSRNNCLFWMTVVHPVSIKKKVALEAIDDGLIRIRIFAEHHPVCIFNKVPVHGQVHDAHLARINSFYIHQNLWGSIQLLPTSEKVSGGERSAIAENLGYFVISFTHAHSPFVFTTCVLPVELRGQTKQCSGFLLKDKWLPVRLQRARCIQHTGPQSASLTGKSMRWISSVCVIWDGNQRSTSPFGMNSCLTDIVEKNNRCKCPGCINA